MAYDPNALTRLTSIKQAAELIKQYVDKAKFGKYHLWKVKVFTNSIVGYVVSKTEEGARNIFLCKCGFRTIKEYIGSYPGNLNIDSSVFNLMLDCSSADVKGTAAEELLDEFVKDGYLFISDVDNYEDLVQEHSVDTNDGLMIIPTVGSGCLWIDDSSLQIDDSSLWICSDWRDPSDSG